jgi:IclR family KDG regulon transcriptional repressor
LLSHVGHYRPITCSSPGKLLLSYQSKEMVHKVIEQGLPKRGPNSVTDPNQLMGQLEKIRHDEYCVSIDEMYEDVISIAAPIKDYNGSVIASVSMAAPRHRINEENIPNYVKDLVKTGRDISSKLGYMESIKI